MSLSRQRGLSAVTSGEESEGGGVERLVLLAFPDGSDDDFRGGLGAGGQSWR
jgi:hypothetical protein